MRVAGGGIVRGERRAERDRLLYSETRWGPRLYSAVVGDRHIVVHGARRKARLFDWRADPAEQVDLASREDPATRAMWRAVQSRRRSLERDPGRRSAEPIAGVTPEQQQQLGALGYVDAE
jgi:hypothetical protein